MAATRIKIEVIGSKCPGHWSFSIWVPASLKQRVPSLTTVDFAPQQDTLPRTSAWRCCARHYGFLGGDRPEFHASKVDIDGLRHPCSTAGEIERPALLAQHAIREN
jgi:hypothetical protein